MKFTELSLDPSLLEGIQVLGFEETTPIQAQAIPPILAGKDVIGCAQTGTGKTAAFLIPTIQRLMQTQAGKIKCLTIVPTRELAVQIDQNMEGLAFYTGVYSVSVYGGNDSKGWDRQKNAITGGVDVVVATPGRFKTHYKLGYMDLSEVEVLILDEADKMLDMGFFEDILEISSYLPKNRQTLMFSATMPPKIRKLAKEILKDPIEITLKLAKPAAGVVQEAYMVYDNQKIPLLERLIKKADVESMIIFASSKASVDRIASRLCDLGIDARAIHSSRDQQERTATLRAFKNKQFPIVVATDVLSRGIDIDSLSHVLNFDVPTDAEDYVHRIGRTARAGSKGAAITFVSPDDMYRFGNIEKLIEQDVPKPEIDKDLGDTPTYRPGGGGKRGGGRRGGGGGRGGNNRGGRNSRSGGGGGNRNSRNRSGGNSGGNREGGGRQNPNSQNRSNSRRKSNDNRGSQNRDKS